MLREGARVGSYIVGSRCERGAFSRVYQAYDETSPQPVAVKVLDAEACAHAELVARFLNEAQILMTLSAPNIIRALSSGELSSGEPYVVLEWQPYNLAQVLAAGPLSTETALYLVEQLATGLVELHTRGLVHRDLKPSNVLLDRDQPSAAHAKLSDLGLAKLVRSDDASDAAILYISTVRGARLGTWEYMPPELWIDAKGVDDRTDVYSLGILLFQMLTGVVPFTAVEPQTLMTQHLFEPPPLKAIEGLLGGEMTAVLAAMLAKRARTRPTAAAILRSIRTHCRR